MDTSEVYIRVSIVHPTAHFLFTFVYEDISKYCFLFAWKANKIKVGEYSCNYE